MFTEFFWDFDGTLFDTYPRMTRAARKALADLGVNAEYTWLLKQMKVSLGEAGRAAAERFGVCPKAFSEAYHRHAEEEGPETILPYPGAVEMCRAVAKTGGHNYLYTHRNHTALDALERCGAREWMLDCVTAEHGFANKPAPDALNHLVAKHALSRAACVMIGDRPIDLQAGKNAGMACALFDPEGFYPDYPVDLRFTRFADMQSALVK